MPLRIIGGSHRGAVLTQPRGTATRPTTARLREALFGVLEAQDAEFAEVLDLYAGTGALGIEALSRGEGRCTFVESDQRAVATIRENLRRTGLAERGTVVVASVGRWRPPDGVRYTLVVADPPYDDAAAWDHLARAVRGALAADGCIAVEHAARAAAPDTLAGLPLWRERRHGDGMIAIYRAPDVPGALVADELVR